MIISLFPVKFPLSPVIFPLFPVLFRFFGKVSISPLDLLRGKHELRVLFYVDLCLTDCLASKLPNKQNLPKKTDGYRKKWTGTQT